MISTALHSPKCLEKGSTPDDDGRTDDDNAPPDDGTLEGVASVGDTGRVEEGATLDEGVRTVVEGATLGVGGRTLEGALDDDDGGVGVVTLASDERVTDDGTTGIGCSSGASAPLSASVNFLYRAEVVLSASYRMVL